MTRPLLDISAWRGLHLLSPHPDDAGFSCPTLLKQVADQGLPIILQTLFDQSSYDAEHRGKNQTDVTRQRFEEDQAFADFISPDCQLIRSGFPEAYMRKAGFQEILSGQYDAGDQDLMPQLLHAVLQNWDPEIPLLAPMGLGQHVDHLLVRDAAIALARHHNGNLILYEDLPYAAGAPEEELIDMMDHLGQAIGFSAKACIVPSSDLGQVKRAAAACYPSQLQGDSLNRILQRGEELSGEGYWHLAWTG